jgi:hypothetical protein
VYVPVVAAGNSFVPQAWRRFLVPYREKGREEIKIYMFFVPLKINNGVEALFDFMEHAYGLSRFEFEFEPKFEFFFHSLLDCSPHSLLLLLLFSFFLTPQGLNRPQ